MTDDERAIRAVVDTWMSASQAGDTATVMTLMADDVVFMVPGAEPFGKAAFAAASAGQQQAHIEGRSDIRELQVLGDWAFLRNYLEVSMTPEGATQLVRRAGYTLTILRKEPDGRWLLARDANLMSVIE
ncbi:SgcJ/EcaC family oxidoreductase [Paraburkholderia sp.]|uniref:SgcJ/EcaC family oxidoreductase n=1 Tax=Paraburkholderia sp. TaxID=1926495 RepID=UPI003D6FA6C4